MTNPTQSPLVSLVVYAFQQERFIEETIAGALSQTYPNLEIILSDDRSTDGTFALMQEAVQRYTGPHRVRARQNPANLGLWGHFMAANSEAEGALIVVSGGDDISLPQRVSRLVEKWQATGAMALASDWLEIDEDSRLLGTGVKHPVAPGNVVWQYFRNKQDRPFIAGTASAYDRRLLDRLPPTSERISHEDSLLTTLATAWQLPIETVGEPLVHYRQHAASYSKQTIHETGYRRVLAEVMLTARFAKANASYLRYALDVLRQDPPVDHPDAAIDWPAAERILALREIEAAFVAPNVGHRLKLVAGAPDPKLRMIAVQRLLPPRAFALLKHLLR